MCFLDGPAAGVLLACRRAPVYLRAARSGIDDWDALDQLNDKPADGETLFAYRRVGEAGSCHIDYRDKQGRRRGDWFQYADYRYIEQQPAAGVMADREQWRAWCVESQKKESGHGAEEAGGGSTGPVGEDGGQAGEGATGEPA